MNMKEPLLVEIRINESSVKRTDQCKQRLPLCRIQLLKDHTDAGDLASLPCL